MRWLWGSREFEEALVSYARTNAEAVKVLDRRIAALEESEILLADTLAATLERLRVVEQKISLR